MPKAFTPEHVEQWLAALRNRPEAFGEIDWPAFPQVESIKVAGLATGAAVRMRTREGDTMEFLINPVAARELIRNLAEVAQRQGWLTDAGEISSPDVPLQS